MCFYISSENLFFFFFSIQHRTLHALQNLNALGSEAVDICSILKQQWWISFQGIRDVQDVGFCSGFTCCLNSNSLWTSAYAACRAFRAWNKDLSRSSKDLLSVSSLKETSSSWPIWSQSIIQRKVKHSKNCSMLLRREFEIKTDTWVPPHFLPIWFFIRKLRVLLRIHNY